MTHGLTRFYSGSSQPMNAIQKFGLLIMGWLFIVVGIIGLFLPILQGILFIMIGLAILSSRSEVTKRFLKHLEERNPRYHERIEIWKEEVRGWQSFANLLSRSFQKVSF